jgi:cell division protein ZapD
MTGRIGQYLRENDWLMSIKQRTGIPGGACEFDLPSYHYWLHRPADERIGQLAAWTSPLYPLRDGTAIILRILRESGKPVRMAAPLGTFQQMLGGKTAQMLRVRLDPGMQCVPEISANKYVLNIRFLAQNGEDPRPKTADWDVGFELTFCNL